MSFFLSSPPQPTYQKPHHQSHPQHSFFTPQTHRTTFFSDSVSWPSLQFQPKSPSPLRPSWNAGNVMRRQPNEIKDTGDDCQSTSDGEIGGWENSRGTGSSPFAAFRTTTYASDALQLPSHPPTTTTPTLFTTQQPPQIDLNPPRNPFTFQSHSQLSHPTTQINTRIRNNRDTRRSLFLDRLRSSRRDERDNNIIEKFEKEEYWRDRKRREERMARAAEVDVGVDVRIGWEDEDVDIDVNGFGNEDEEEGLSPVDEERELGDLVEGWFEGEQQQQRQRQVQDQNQDDDFMDAQLDFDDSDVEEAFMQVLSQQEQIQSQQPRQLIGQPIPRIGDGEGDGSGMGDKDAEMS